MSLSDSNASSIQFCITIYTHDPLILLLRNLKPTSTCSCIIIKSVSIITPAEKAAYSVRTILLASAIVV